MSLTTTAARRRSLSGYYLALETKLALTSVVALVFCIAMPIALYLLFGATFGKYPAGNGNMNAVILSSMGIYGAAMTATSCAYSLPVERASGWNRELRLTPLRPWAYVLGKVLAAMIAALVSLIVLYAVGLIVHQAQMPISSWFATLGIAWLSSIGWAALGLFIGLMINKGDPSAVIVPVILVCSFLSGVFQIPFEGRVWQIIRQIIPMGGPVRWSESMFGSQVATTDWTVWTNTIGWTVVFFLLAAWAFSRDTRRG
ncbi:MAG: ABC transporter permease [Propionibacteriaceae bacterium]|jgi:ABC-2 type transport system permease protein|nr:ABC transporter permease [Propionibacteriaceae bacterium]